MAKTVTIAGHKVNQWVVYGGVGVAVVGGVLLIRRRSASSGTAAGSSPNAIDPLTQLPYSMDNQTDPATGDTYLAEAQQYGSVSAAEAAISQGYDNGGYGGIGYSGLGYGYPTYTSGSGTGTPGAPGGYTDNAQWAQAVEAGISGLGYAPAAVGAAIGRYLAKLPLSAEQVTIVQTAVAEYGPPPVGSYPIIAAPPGGGGSGGGGKGGKPEKTVPDVVGRAQEVAYAILSAAGFHPHGSPGVRGKTLTVDSQSPKGGTKAAEGSTVTLHSTVHEPKKPKK